MTRLRTLAASTALLILAACATVGPDHVAPPPPAAAAGPFLLSGAGTRTAPALDGDWWRLYRDPVLDRLVADALAANTDIRVAVARLERARAGLRGARTARTPQAGIGAGARYGAIPELRTGEDLILDPGLDVAYEVDLFGRVARGIEAAEGDVGAAEADAAAVRVLVAAETARAYAEAASAAERRQVAERIVALLDRSVALTQRRHAVGLGTGLDIARIAALRDQRRADIPALIATREAALARLATLTGRTLAELPAEAGARAETLRIDQPIPVGDGATLLRRRPDVRAAERRLAASTARIGVASADLYPRITLGGSLGASAGAGDIFSAPVRWLFGPLLNWAANREPARARIAAAEADARADLARFDGVVLRAIEETEIALSAYGRTLERRDALLSARDEAAGAVRITRARQQEGDIGSLELIDAERTFAEAEAELARADALIADRQVDLLRALGGGWSFPTPAAKAIPLSKDAP